MQRRKLGLGIVGLCLGLSLLVVATVVAVWFFALRDGGAGVGAGSPGEQRAAAAADRRGAATDGEAGGSGGEAAGPAWDLDPEGPLRLDGQVVDGSGAPVGDAVIVIDSSPPRATRSQADGSFHFDQLIGRGYSLRGRSGTLVGALTSRLTGTSDPVVLRLRQGLTVGVTVKDAAGAPIRGALVRISDEDLQGIALAEAAPTFPTDAQGRALMTGVAPGWSSLVVSAEGYARAFTHGSISAAGVPPGEIAREISVTLHRGVAVSGKVVDERGAAVAGAKVTVRSSTGRNRPSDVVSDASGEFRFAAVAPGNYTFAAADGMRAPGETPLQTVGEAALGGLVILLLPGGTLGGVVVTPGGAAVPHAMVRIAVASESGDDFMRVFESVRQIASDAQGRFEVRGLPRARLELRAEGEAAASQIVEASLVETPRQDGLRVVLDAERTISGVVVDETGEPVPEVMVQASARFSSGANPAAMAVSGGDPSTTSDGNGAFTLRGLADGLYSVWAAREARNEAERLGQPIKAGEQGVRLVLSRPGRLLGKLSLDGKPPARANVFLQGDTMVSARAGAFVIEDLQPGTYALRVRGPDFLDHAVEGLVVAAGRDTDVGTIALPRGRRLTGRVIDADQRPVAGAKVRSGVVIFHDLKEDAPPQSQHLPGMLFATTDAQGAFVLSGLPDRPQLVSADHASGRSASVSVPGGAQDPPPMTLQLVGFGSIRGVVRALGKPAGDIMVSLSGSVGTTSAWAMSNADGSYLVENVPAGVHQVIASRMGGMTRRNSAVTVTVVAGQRATADLTLAGGTLTLRTPITALPGATVEAAHVFLLAGTVNATDGKMLAEHLGKRVLGVEMWSAGGAPPTFHNLDTDDYTVCARSLPGSLKDPEQMQRMFQHLDQSIVTCKPVKLAAAPAVQQVPLQLPSPRPLPPAPATGPGPGPGKRPLPATPLRSLPPPE